jgi:hypothetical protein
LGAAVLSAPGKAQAQRAPADIRWDYEADVIVCGSGRQRRRLPCWPQPQEHHVRQRDDGGDRGCGIPGTPMPAWLKGAYTKVECYGMPFGSTPAGMTVPAILTADEIKALVDYVFATFVRLDDQESRIYTEPRCIEGNYGLPGLLHGRRVEEAAFAEGRGPDPTVIDNTNDGLLLLTKRPPSDPLQQ